MEKIQRIRLRKLKEYITQNYDGSVASFADDIEMRRTQIYRLFGRGAHARRLGEDLARDIEERLGKDEGWLDKLEEPDKTRNEELIIKAKRPDPLAGQKKEIVELYVELTAEQRKQLIRHMRKVVRHNRSMPHLEEFDPKKVASRSRRSST